MPVYLDTEEHRDVLFRHLRGIVGREGTPNNIVNEVDFLMDVLFPEVMLSPAAPHFQNRYKNIDFFCICRLKYFRKYSHNVPTRSHWHMPNTYLLLDKRYTQGKSKLSNYLSTKMQLSP